MFSYSSAQYCARCGGWFCESHECKGHLLGIVSIQPNTVDLFDPRDSKIASLERQLKAAKKKIKQLKIEISGGESWI